MSDTRRKLPSIDALLRSDPGVRAAAEFGRPLVAQALRQALAEARVAMTDGIEAPEDDALLGRAVRLAARAAFGAGRVLNATGVVLHTGLGRAPLSEGAAAAAARVATGYSDLEVDRGSGARGKRTARAETILTALTGAEAALVVNNGAAALLLALAALAKGRQVPVSRGELIEIGGEFRLPDIMAASGGKLVEVGTTNRTRISDFKAAVTDKTGLLLKVHPSNYQVIGFAETPTVSQLSGLAHTNNIPFVFDVGSGLLHRSKGLPVEEPAVDEALRDGADLVLFSGDKLLGGPQAGIIVGKADLIDRLRRNPIARAVRVDKMQISALEHVLAAYARGQRDELPVWRMLQTSEHDLKERAHTLARSLYGDLEGVTAVRVESVAGGGSLPGYAEPSWGVRLVTSEPHVFAAHLRMGSPSVFCRVDDTAVTFDLRTIAEEDLDGLRRAITYAMDSGADRDLED